MPDEIKEIKPPTGFKKRFWNAGNRQVLQSEDGIIIPLHNRHFRDIDYKMGNLISEGIDNKIKENAKIKILDIGSGTDSVAAGEIASQYGDQVEVFALDFFPEIPGERNMSVIRGAAEKIPLKSESVDVIFSHKTFEHVDSGLQKSLVDEIIRLLKPGGYAILEWYDTTYDKDGNVGPGFAPYMNKLGIMWNTTLISRGEPGTSGTWIHVLFKPPIDEEFLAKFHEVKEKLRIKEEGASGDS